MYKLKIPKTIKTNNEKSSACYLYNEISNFMRECYGRTKFCKKTKKYLWREGWTISYYLTPEQCSAKAAGMCTFATYSGIHILYVADEDIYSMILLKYPELMDYEYYDYHDK